MHCHFAGEETEELRIQVCARCHQLMGSRAEVETRCAPDSGAATVTAPSFVFITSGRWVGEGDSDKVMG